jgi:hypothetical protein
MTGILPPNLKKKTFFNSAYLKAGEWLSARPGLAALAASLASCRCNLSASGSRSSGMSVSPPSIITADRAAAGGTTACWAPTSRALGSMSSKNEEDPRSMPGDMSRWSSSTLPAVAGGGLAWRSTYFVPTVGALL